MKSPGWSTAVLGTLVCIFSLGLAGVLAAPSNPPLAQSKDVANVDAELVLAVDVSYSMDPDEQALQREGYVAALTSPDFLNALRSLGQGRIAVTYFEWAGVNDQKIVMPWRLVDGPEAADAVAAEIARAPYRRASRTSIAGALTFAMPLFGAGDYRGLRRIIDVSGDGPNNQGPPVTILRDQALEKGITINGLPILLKRPNPGTMDIENLDVYYEDCVIGGPGSFVIPIKERDRFKEAIRTKLVLEIAGRPPDARVRRAQAKAPRIDCLIGERLWQQRWGGGMDRL